MTARYGVYIGEQYEPWMEEFDTLKKARAEVRKWTDKEKPRRYPTPITLVRIISEHEEGSTS